MIEKNYNFADIKVLASSIASALDMLYTFNVMHSDNSIEEINKSNGVIFTIQTAAGKLSEMIETLDKTSYKKSIPQMKKIK